MEKTAAALLIPAFKAEMVTEVMRQLLVAHTHGLQGLPTALLFGGVELVLLGELSHQQRYRHREVERRFSDDGSRQDTSSTSTVADV